MHIKRFYLPAFLIIISCSPALFAGDSELAVGKAQEGILAAGKTQSFALSLKSEDYVQIKLDPRGTEVLVMAYDPSGRKLHGDKVGPGEGGFIFIAEGAGAYRVEVAAADKSRDGTFKIALDKVVTLEARLAPPKPAFESLRIKALREAVESGSQASVAAFWDEVKRHGTPLIEPLDGDGRNMLVTYLWKGTAATQDVLVLWYPIAVDKPDDHYMIQLKGTDVWYRTVRVGKTERFEYSVAPNVPRPYGAPQGLDNDVLPMIAAAIRPDPLNPKRWRVDNQSVDAPERRGNSVVEMPDAPAQPWLAERPDGSRGTVEKRQIKSALLKNEREIATYLPPGYSKDGKPYPLLVLFDERSYLEDKRWTVVVPTQTILDNLIAEKRIPPMVALLVDNVPGARGSELPCNPVFADFLATELLPWAHGLYNLTTDPAKTVVGGSSYGGLAATYAGLRHPEAFGNVLSQSGSYMWMPGNNGHSSDSEEDSEPNWVARQFIASPKLPLRFYLEAGSDEIDLSGNGNSILLANRNLRDVLRAKGYEVHFHMFAGGHDYLSWRGTLADGLILLMESKQAKPEQEATKP